MAQGTGRLAFLGTVALLLLAAGCATAQDPRSGRLQLDAPVVTIPLREGPDNLYSLELFLEGDGPFFFLLDSGSEVLALDPSVAARFEAARDGLPFRLRGALGGNPLEVPRGAIAEVSFQPPSGPGARIHDVPFVTVPAPHCFDGIVGLGLFRGCRLVLDFPHEVLEVAVPEATGPRLFAGARSRLPVATVRIGEVDVDVVLDTGFPGTLYLPPEVAAGLPALGPKTGVILLADVAGSRAVEQRHLNGEVRLGEGGSLDPWILVGEGGALLGTAFLRSWRLTLDGEGRFVELTAPR